MGELVADVDTVQEVLTSIRAVGQHVEPDRVPPSIGLCGSDEVIEAFVQAFRMIEQQDANAWAGWVEVARRGEEGLAELVRADAALAAEAR
ncbi:hypothetical protein [Cellulomonas sp. NPDC058312]|jgi:hypothetical protein|uniref:hypothetical protein n=1 Tax=Cellulomonas sp. NPDC058312 TaxID=3346441 RepID=UPI0036EE43F6